VMRDEVILIVLGWPSDLKEQLPRGIALFHMPGDPDTAPTYYTSQK
jgi:hypothetical protein